MKTTFLSAAALAALGATTASISAQTADSTPSPAVSVSPAASASPAATTSAAASPSPAPSASPATDRGLSQTGKPKSGMTPVSPRRRTVLMPGEKIPESSPAAGGATPSGINQKRLRHLFMQSPTATPSSTPKPAPEKG